ncbi:MAG: DUF4124 domain-containing protein [Pseudomonadota bacterium]|uniref:DUF4124 domain-containing protein n=1 Tax=Polaromonas sp. TaxID=1869339 RepID=UPI00184E7BB9|nr:DUF4124 domain-containing protein [Polaromonas sp.]MBA3593440.1 DUF4124 domain-containing protein [Polaromonas sp.]MDQ3272260.1 DUF4124 domain-containing protein [Pseudomonadota bacterium]
MPLQLNTATLLAVSLCSLAVAQPASSGIYSCIDGKGRRITADRPIAECMDRTQKQLSGSGMVKREIAPMLTTDERAAVEVKEKAAAEQRAREAEEKKRDRALLTRYPDRAAHDKERAAALVQVEEAIKASVKRAQELVEQRKAIQGELEFYKATPGRAPISLKRRLDENDSSVAEQKRFMAEQEAEKKRVNQRFDDQLAKLRPFWSEATAAASANAAKR